MKYPPKMEPSEWPQYIILGTFLDYRTKTINLLKSSAVPV